MIEKFVPPSQLAEIADQAIQDRASAIKHMVIGSIIQEYGLLLIGDQKHELKHRCSVALNAVRSVQSCLLNHPNSTGEIRELLRKEFLKDSYVLIADLLTAVWNLRESDLEWIISEIRNHTETEAITSETDSIATE